MKMMRIGAAIAIAAAAMTAQAAAQEAAAPRAKDTQPAAERRAPVPLRLQLVLSRMQGDKKVSSTPYGLWLADDRSKSSLRMGNQIPIPDGKGGYTYRDVGTNIDAMVLSSHDGIYTVSIVLTDSSVYFPDRNDPSAASPSNTGMPAFRSFTSSFNVVLKDGQVGQYLSATDQVSGQVLKLDATLTVLK